MWGIPQGGGGHGSTPYKYMKSISIVLNVIFKGMGSDHQLILQRRVLQLLVESPLTIVLLKLLLLLLNL